MRQNTLLGDISGSQAYRGSTHGPIEKQMCHLKAEKNKSFWMFTEPDTVCLCICIFILFYYPTLSLLCMFQSYSDNLFCGWTSSCFFFMTEHINYSVFCNQKQGSTKNVNTNLSGNLYGATYFFLARFARSVFKILIKCILQSSTR